MVFGARKIVWSSLAKIEKRKIFKYWNERNKSQLYSKKLNDLFNEKTARLSETPLIGRKTDFENVRVVIIRDYLMIYKIFKNHILIISIWEGHQNPDDSFFAT